MSVLPQTGMDPLLPPGAELKERDADSDPRRKIQFSVPSPVPIQLDPRQVEMVSRHGNRDVVVGRRLSGLVCRFNWLVCLPHKCFMFPFLAPKTFPSSCPPGVQLHVSETCTLTYFTVTSERPRER